MTNPVDLIKEEIATIKDQLDIDLLANRMTDAAGNAIDNLPSHLDNAQHP